MVSLRSLFHAWRKLCAGSDQQSGQKDTSADDNAYINGRSPQYAWPESESTQLGNDLLHDWRRVESILKGPNRVVAVSHGDEVVLASCQPSSFLCVAMGFSRWTPEQFQRYSVANGLQVFNHSGLMDLSKELEEPRNLFPAKKKKQFSKVSRSSGSKG